LATPSPGAALLALVTPLVLFHVDYLPGFTLGAGEADVDVLLSDVALVVLGVAVAAGIARSGLGVLRPGFPVWVLSAALLAWVAIGTLLPLLSDRDYAFGTHLITAAKFAEYAVLALAVTVLARTRAERELLLAVIAGWAVLAAVVGLMQFAGVDVFDAWAAGRRQPSFLGHHDFAALSGCGFGIGLAALVFRRHERFAVVACVAGATGLVVSGSLAGLLGIAAVLGAAAVVSLRRRTGLRPLGVAGAGVVAVALLLVAFRGNDLDDFLRFTGVLDPKREQEERGVETYSHRTLLAYLGLRIWVDHPVAGAGWQASGEYDVVRPYLPDAHRRFPDVPEEAFPVPGRRYGVQNAWVQSLADLGVVGLLLFGGLLAAGFWLAERRALRTGAWTALAAAGILVVVASVWTAQGLVAALALDSLTWLGLGLAASVPTADP
jgi:O-antigen ligase